MNNNNSKTKFLQLKKHVSVRDTNIEVEHFIKSATESNTYLSELQTIFSQLDFNVFSRLGQRNISGFIGEVFKNFICKNVYCLKLNPHPDGRPDALLLSENIASEYYKTSCFESRGGMQMPIKANLTPFPFGGIEIKSSIGSQKASSKEALHTATGKTSFAIGISRIEYISGITFWAHHQHSTNLVGLFYDYYSKSDFVPQILAVFSCDLDKSDWHTVSTGNPGAKKTSNTSLSKTGVKKLYSNCVAIVDDSLYIKKFTDLGIKI